VSVSLVWTALAALTSTSPVESLLFIVVGTLWVGPDAVQAAVRNLW